MRLTESLSRAVSIYLFIYSLFETQQSDYGQGAWLWNATRRTILIDELMEFITKMSLQGVLQEASAKYAQGCIGRNVPRFLCSNILSIINKRIFGLTHRVGENLRKLHVAKRYAVIFRQKEKIGSDNPGNWIVRFSRAMKYFTDIYKTEDPSFL